MPLKIMIVDDHSLFRKGLLWLLKMEKDFLAVAEADNGNLAVQYAKEIQPDVIVMDINMSGMDGIDATRRIVAENPDIKVLTLTSESDSGYAVKALKAGARGFITKDAVFAELAAGIRSVAHGKPYLCRKISELVLRNYSLSMPCECQMDPPSLTTDELDIVRHIVDGRKIWDLAHIFEVSDNIIDSQLQSIMKKFDLYSIESLTKYAAQQ